MSGLGDDITKMLMRLHMIKDMDPFNKKLLNDCYNLLKKLEEERESLRKQLNIQTV
jgi:hypothetical protein